MSKYVFKKIKDETNKFEISDIEMTVDTVSLNDLLQEFQFFLLASGYTFDGDVDIVKNDE